MACPLQAMERRYTALAEDLGRLAADKEKCVTEKTRLAEVRSCGLLLRASSEILCACDIDDRDHLADTLLGGGQELSATQADKAKLHIEGFEKDSLLQRKDVEVRRA